MNRARFASILVSVLFLLGAVASSEAATFSEYSFYQPQEYSQGAYYWSAYLQLWANRRFDLWLRSEQTYPGALGQCDQVRLYLSHGNKYTMKRGRAKFPGSAVYDVNDDCTPSADLHRPGRDTLTWSYRPYGHSRTAQEFVHPGYDLPFNDFVFYNCNSHTNSQRHDN